MPTDAAQHLKIKKPYPVHLIAFAIFPIVALLARNIREVEIDVALRPVLISVLGTVVLLII